MDINFIIYLTAAIIGVFTYNYIGYLKLGKPNGEPYNPAKLLDTLTSGGTISALTTTVITLMLGSTEFSFIILVNAFGNGVMLSAGYNQIYDFVSPKRSTPENLADIMTAINDLINKYNKLAASTQTAETAQIESSQVTFAPSTVT